MLNSNDQSYTDEIDDARAGDASHARGDTGPDDKADIAAAENADAKDEEFANGNVYPGGKENPEMSPGAESDLKNPLNAKDPIDAESS